MLILSRKFRPATERTGMVLRYTDVLRSLISLSGRVSVVHALSGTSMRDDVCFMSVEMEMVCFMQF